MGVVFLELIFDTLWTEISGFFNMESITGMTLTTLSANRLIHQLVSYYQRKTLFFGLPFCRGVLQYARTLTVGFNNLLIARFF